MSYAIIDKDYKRSHTMELLAPAGNRENLIAALQAGCDAVYLGASSYSARAYAGNFTMETLKEALDYIHIYGAKAFLTVNTLLKDEEIEGAVELCRTAWNLGVDAIIFQDPGLLYLLKTMYPEIELHASTQVSIHNPHQGFFFKEQGVKRLILARELTLEEIRGMKVVEVDLETFVQGALCISYSGQCLMSSLIGGRSGNRGRCAQPCRLPYSLYKGDEKISDGHLLSPKDLSLIHNLHDLKDAGIMSLKLEGRMRSPGYVYESVTAYRRALDTGVVEDKSMKQAFNRQGFTKGYLFNERGPSLMASTKPSRGGIPLGHIERGKIKLKENLRVGDGIATPRGGFRVEEIFIGNSKVKEAKIGETVSLKPTKFSEGDALLKNVDTAHDQMIKQMVSRPFDRKIEVPVDFTFKVGDPMKLGDLEGAVVETPLRAPLSVERVLENLEKSGDTPYKLKPSVLSFEEGFVPMKALNGLRRAFVERLEASLKVERELKRKELPELPHLKEVDEKFVVIREKRYLDLDYSGLSLIIDPFYKDKGSMSFSDLEDLKDYYVRVPGIIKEDLESLSERLLKLKGLKGVLTSNQGLIRLLKGRIRLLGDYKLNLLNSYGSALYEACNGLMVSEEASKKELSALKNKEHFVVGVYGPQEMMVLEHCLTKKEEGPCQCDLSRHYLEDQKGYKLPIAKDLFCRNHIYNGVVKNILGEMKELRKIGYKSFIMELFLDDHAEEALEAFKEEKPLSIPASTRGHHNRGVE